MIINHFQVLGWCLQVDAGFDFACCQSLQNKTTKCQDNIEQLRLPNFHDCSNPSPNISRKICKQNQALISFLTLKGHNDCNCSLQIVGFIFGKVQNLEFEVQNLEFETWKVIVWLLHVLFPCFCPPIFGREFWSTLFWEPKRKKNTESHGKQRGSPAWPKGVSTGFRVKFRNPYKKKLDDKCAMVKVVAFFWGWETSNL